MNVSTRRRTVIYPVLKYKIKVMKKSFAYKILVRFANFQTKKMSVNEKPVETSITRKLQEHLKPSFLKVINESYMHNVPKNAETHFKVVVVSEEFRNIPLIKRHRKVNEILKEELQSGVHALSIMAKTSEQWTNEEIEPSPNCRGGFGK